MLNEQKITDTISIGGKPSAADIEELHSRGFKTVVNLLMPDEPGALEEERLVENTGMDYSHVPVSPATLDDIALARFSQAIESSDGPVAVHCKGGGRAGVLTLIHLAIEHGWSIEEALEEGQKQQIKVGEDSPYRAFFENYLRRHSAGERR